MSKSWPLLTLAVLGAVAALFCLAAFDWAVWACRLPTGEEGKVLTPSVGGCVEFWLYRYQTLIGALAAVGAACVAWSIGSGQIKGIKDQIREARIQTTLIAAQAAATRIDELRGISQKSIRARYLINEIIREWPNCYAILVRAKNLLDEASRGQGPTPLSEVIDTIRSNIAPLSSVADKVGEIDDLLEVLPTLAFDEECANLREKAEDATCEFQRGSNNMILICKSIICTEGSLTPPTPIRMFGNEFERLRNCMSGFQEAYTYFIILESRCKAKIEFNTEQMIK